MRQRWRSFVDWCTAMANGCWFEHQPVWEDGVLRCQRCWLVRDSLGVRQPGRP